MAIDFQALLLPISAEAPGGVEPRETPQYETVYAEIERLTSPSADRQPDWNVVERQSTELFKSTTKDFMVAAWLSAAWVERSSLEGLAAGLGLFAGLTKEFWATAYPPLKRLRGRRNAFLWWSDRVTAWLGQSSFAPISVEQHATLLERIKEIDRIFAELDPEAPALNDLIGLIDRLEVVLPSATQTPVAEALATTDPAPSVAAAGAPVVAAGPVTGAAPLGAAARQTGPAFTGLGTVASADDLIEALGPIFAYLGEVSQKIAEFEPLNRLSVSLNRLGARAALLTLPDAQGSVTRIGAPPAADVQSFEAVCASGNLEGIIAFCEARLATYPCWLDLDRQSAQAYGAMGPQAAGMREEIIDSVLSFTKRLPGVASLAFADGMPFADEATRAWLQTCQAERLGAGEQDRFSEVKKQALQASGAGEAAAAAAILQDFASGSRSGRDQFRARLAFAELALSLKNAQDAQTFVDPLLDECERMDLVRWEPELALQAWTLKLRAARAWARQLEQSAESEKIALNQNVIEHALKKISLVDFSEAIRQA